MKYSVTLYAALSLILVTPKFAQAEDNENQFYVNSGVSWLNNDIKTKQAWMSSIGYSYVFNPIVGLDVGYLDISSDETYTSRYNTLMPNITYKGLFGGAKIQQPLFDVAIFYAKGGVSFTSYNDNLELNGQTDTNSLDNYLISPYFSIGANIPSIFEPKLNLNLELSSQDLELDNANTIFMLGAQYRF
jgi:hypothetical protein